MNVQALFLHLSADREKFLCAHQKLEFKEQYFPAWFMTSEPEADPGPIENLHKWDHPVLGVDFAVKLQQLFNLWNETCLHIHRFWNI